MAAQRKKAVLTSPPRAGDLCAQLVKRGMVAPLLSIVVPVKNEEQAIAPFIERVSAIEADKGRQFVKQRLLFRRAIRRHHRQRVDQSLVRSLLDALPIGLEIVGLEEAAQRRQ